MVKHNGLTVRLESTIGVMIEGHIQTPVHGTMYGVIKDKTSTVGNWENYFIPDLILGEYGIHQGASLHELTILGLRDHLSHRKKSVTKLLQIWQ